VAVASQEGAPVLREGALILGIETSCDETAASVVQVAGGVLRVRSTVVASQHAVHERFAGVVPELASRAHLARIAPVIQQALAEASCDLGELSAVAVGHRPGLIGSLLVGTAAAKALAWCRGLPFLGVDHVQAHLVAAFLDREAPEWPALGLVVSGGHTHLARMTGPCDVEVIGRTIDDAVGEAFDKAAVVLELGYPGGPRLDAASTGGNPRAVALPVPRLQNPLDFSFSGLKTALLYEVRGVPPDGPTQPLTPERQRDLAACFQHAAVRQLVQRTGRALDQDSSIRALVMGGGVVANRALRSAMTELATQRALPLCMPKPEHCVDNAAMIAGMAHYRLARNERDPWWLAPSARSARPPVVRGTRGPGPLRRS
jgi:N6-L-threonylcarbamoyladenine synthase